LRRWREQRRAKRALRGPSTEALQEGRNADKVWDPDTVARNARKYFGPPSA